MKYSIPVRPLEDVIRCKSHNLYAYHSATKPNWLGFLLISFDFLFCEDILNTMNHTTENEVKKENEKYLR